MKIDETFNKAMKTIAEAVGDTDRAARYAKPDDEWTASNTVYAMDYEVRNDVIASIYVTSEEIYEYMGVKRDDAYSVYRFSNNGQTIRTMTESGVLIDVPVGIIKDMYSMCKSSFARSRMKMDNDSSTVTSSRSSVFEAVMPKHIKLGGVLYEASEAGKSEIVDEMIDLDGDVVKSKDLKVEEAAKIFFKEAIIEAVTSNKKIDETDGSYGRVERIDIDGEGTMTAHMSIEMPSAEEAEPKYVKMKVRIWEKLKDALDEAFHIEFSDIEVTENAIEPLTEADNANKEGIVKAVRSSFKNIMDNVRTNYMSNIVKGLERVGRSKSISSFLLDRNDIYGYDKFNDININFARILEGTGNNVDVHYLNGGKGMGPDKGSSGSGLISSSIALNHNGREIKVNLEQKFGDGSDGYIYISANDGDKVLSDKIHFDDSINILELQKNIKKEIKDFVLKNFNNISVLSESEESNVKYKYNRPLYNKNLAIEDRFDSRQIMLENWLNDRGFTLYLSAYDGTNDYMAVDDTSAATNWILKAELDNKEPVYIVLKSNNAVAAFIGKPSKNNDKNIDMFSSDVQGTSIALADANAKIKKLDSYLKNNKVL